MMVITMDLIYVLLCILIHLTLTDSYKSYKDYLFFASPGSVSPLLRPGLYGGPIRYQGSGNASEVYNHGLTCVQLEQHTDPVTELKVKAVAYDIKTGYVLMHVGEPSDPNQVTLLKAPVCAANEGCPNKYVEVVLNTASIAHKIVSFASYANQIYFLTERTIKLSPLEQKKYIEIRWLTGCGNGQSFAVDRCSKTIAVVIEEIYRSRSLYKTTSGLAVIPSRNSKGNTLTFFVQMQHKLTDRELTGVEKQAFVLFRVTEDGQVSREHEELVHEALNRYTVQGVGQINYRHNFMCWTALDRVVCGEVDSRGRLSNARVILAQQQVKYICQAPPGQDIISTITTGVAIAKVPKDINRDEVALYFGCVATSKGIGGAGLVRKTGRAPAQIFPLRHSGSRVLAGSMFMTTPKFACGPGEYVGRPANVMSFAVSIHMEYHVITIMVLFLGYLLIG